MTKQAFTIDFIRSLTEMDEHDAHNLMFLLNTSAEVLNDWYEKVDSDDHEYAEELLYLFQESLQNFQTEIKLKKSQHFIEANFLINKIKENIKE